MGNFYTPVAPCKYAWLTKPDTRWKKEDGEFKVNLVFPPDHEFVKQMDEEAKAAFAEAENAYADELEAMAPRARKSAQPLVYHDPITDELDEEKEPTGNLMMCFKTAGAYVDKKTKEKKRVTIKAYDAFGRPISKVPNVGSGSELVVQYRPYSHVIKGTFYYTLYLNAYQIVTLVEFDGGDGGFKAQKGGWTAPEETDAGETDAGETDF